MSCLVCGESCKTGSKKLKNGKVCKNCISNLPSLLLSTYPDAHEYTLKHAIEKTRENMERFCATASYGKLHIDSIHNLFCIADKLNKDGKPKSGNNVFSVYDLTEVGVFCKSPRADHNNVLADIEFRCSIEAPRLTFSVLIKKGVHCHTKRVDSQNVEWDEPSDLSMFRILFNQMITDTFENVNQMLCGKTVHEFEIEKARAIFMLSEDYTIDDLKKARRLMMKVYHPDIAKEDVTREAQIINDAYGLLMAEAERRIR